MDIPGNSLGTGFGRESDTEYVVDAPASLGNDDDRYDDRGDHAYKAGHYDLSVLTNRGGDEDSESDDAGNPVSSTYGDEADEVAHDDSIGYGIRCRRPR